MRMKRATNLGRKRSGSDGAAHSIPRGESFEPAQPCALESVAIPPEPARRVATQAGSRTIRPICQRCTCSVKSRTSPSDKITNGACRRLASGSSVVCFLVFHGFPVVFWCVSAAFLLLSVASLLPHCCLIAFGFFSFPFLCFFG